MENRPPETTPPENTQPENTQPENAQPEDTQPGGEPSVPDRAAAASPEGVPSQPQPEVEASVPEQPLAPGSVPASAASPPPSPPPHGPAPWYGGGLPPVARAPDAGQRVGVIIAIVLGVLAVAIVGCCVSAALGVGIFGAISRQISGPGATETVSKTFSVSQRPTLVIHDTAGNVTVTPGPDGQVAINATKRVRGVSDADARRILGQLQVDMTQDGNTVTVETHFPSGSNLGSRSVDIDVTAPAASQLTFDLTAGNVTVRKISGQMFVTTTAGNIETQDVTFAGASQFSATAGNVTLDGQMSSASTLQAQVKTGNITLRLPATTPAHLDARTDIGNVSVHGWSVTATRQGAGMQAVGDLNPSATDQITLRANTGNISVEQR